MNCSALRALVTINPVTSDSCLQNGKGYGWGKNLASVGDLCVSQCWYEPPHDKTNNVACVPNEDSDQPGHLPPRLNWVFAVRMKKAWVLSYPMSAQRRLWSDWANAQADPPRLIWVFAWRTVILLVLSWGGSHTVYFKTFSKTKDMRDIKEYGENYIPIISVPLRWWKLDVINERKPYTIAGRSSSIRCVSAWHAKGRGFDPHVQQHSFVETGNEIISSAILSPSRWFKKGRCQLLAKECALSTGKLPRNSVDMLTDRARNDMKSVEGP